MFSTSNILSKEKMEELQKNPFFDKYAEKIAQLQKWVGALLNDSAENRKAASHRQQATAVGVLASYRLAFLKPQPI